jgi:hypothetical protein
MSSGVGLSVSNFTMNYVNTSLYEIDDINWRFDLILDIGSVSKVDNLLQRIRKVRSGMADRMKTLLDKETTLTNGRKRKFREALEDLLKIMRYNDAILLEWEARPEVKKEVARRLRRIALLEQEMLPQLHALSANTRDRREKRKLDRQYRLLEKELVQHQLFIREAKDPRNLEYFELAGVHVIPFEFGWYETTVFDVAGMGKVNHTGVLIDDLTAATIPAPKQDDFEEAVEDYLEGRALKQRDETAVDSEDDSSDDRYDETMARTLDQLSLSFFSSSST